MNTNSGYGRTNNYSRSQVGTFVQSYLVIFCVGMEVLAEYYEPSSFQQCMLNSAQMPYVLLRFTCIFQLLRAYNLIQGMGDSMRSFCDKLQNIQFILSFYTTMNHWVHFRTDHYEKNDVSHLTKFTLDITHGFGAFLVMSLDLVLYSNYKVQAIHEYFIDPFVIFQIINICHILYIVAYGSSLHPQINEDIQGELMNLMTYGVLFMFAAAYLKTKVEMLRDFMSDESNMIPKKLHPDEGDTYDSDWTSSRSSSEQQAYLKQRNHWMKKDLYEEKKNKQKY